MPLPLNYVRREVRRHNSFLGMTRMARMNMNSISGALTTTREAKRLAQVISIALQQLDTELRTRVDDPDNVRRYE